MIVNLVDTCLYVSTTALICSI